LTGQEILQESIEVAAFATATEKRSPRATVIRSIDANSCPCIATDRGVRGGEKLIAGTGIGLGEDLGRNSPFGLVPEL